MNNVKTEKRDKLLYSRGYHFIQKIIMSNYLGRKIYRIATYVLLSDLAFVFMLPFIYMIITSIKTDSDLLNITVKWVSTTIFPDNYIRAFNALGYFTHLRNSVFVTTLGIFGHIFSCSLAGYGFAKHKFPGRNILFALVILSIITPIQVIILPLYLRFGALNMLGTYLPLIIPTFLGYGLHGGLFIFIYRQYFLGIPKEFVEAAKIDGCGYATTFLKIIFPMAKSPTLVTMVLSMIWHWNDYFEPSLYLRRPFLYLLPQNLPEIYQLFKMSGKVDTVTGLVINTYNEAVFMAATFLTVVPLLMAYLLLQRHFVEGIERTGHVE